jgi:hypothetical protein
MNSDDFRNKLSNYFEEFKRTLASDNGDWVVKGFIDIYRNIYTISIDTKVVSKIIELMLFPIISRFASENKYKMILSEHQNHYPDITFIMQNNNKIALDLKSTYRTGPNTVNGFTLGAFTGYFRQRQSNKNITFPYEQYAAHFVLGVIYSRREEAIDEKRIHRLDDLQDIISVVKDFSFLFQEKWRIAGEQPGSGNTKNIGSVRKIEELIGGKGPFESHGKEIYDDYWMNYLTADMARAIESNVPFRNLKEYFQWRNRFNKKKKS